MDVGEHTAGRDGHAAEQLVELLVVADRELPVARDDARALVVARRVARELEDLRTEVLPDRGQVDRGAGADARFGAFHQLARARRRREVGVYVGDLDAVLNAVIRSPSRGVGARGVYSIRSNRPFSAPAPPRPPAAALQPPLPPPPGVPMEAAEPPAAEAGPAAAAAEARPGRAAAEVEEDDLSEDGQDCIHSYLLRQ